MDKRPFMPAALVSTALPGFAGGHGRLGDFSGVNNHTVPDSKIALGEDGVYDPETLIFAMCR